MKNVFKIAAALTALGFATTASAFDTEKLHGWSVKIGVNKISPQVKSDDMTAPSQPGTKVDIGSDVQPIFTIGYAYNQNISVELFLGTPYKHDISGSGSIIGVGKAATIKSMPPTIFGQYRFFEQEAKVRPYVGLGLTYGYFYDPQGSAALTALTNTGSSTPTTFTVDNAWGLTPQLGLVYNFDKNWFADVVVTKTFMKTRAHYSTGQTIDMRLDPVATAFAIGYHF